MDKKIANEPAPPYTISMNGDTFNTSSTLKLAENAVYDKNDIKMSKLSLAENEKYNPFEHRDMSQATPDSGALLHLLKSSLGSGILAMPSAFKNGGLIFGIIGTVLVGLICTHCVHILVVCSQVLAERLKVPSLGFAETAEAAFKTGPRPLRKFSTAAWIFVQVALFATYYLGNTVYVVFMANSLMQVLGGNGVPLDVRVCILIVAVPLLPLGSVRSLRYLVPFSAIATVLIIVGLVMTLYFTLSDLPDISQRNNVVAPVHWPLFFSTVLFAMEGIGTVLPIENSMKTPGHFLGCPGVLNIAMTVVVVLYALVGFCGYWQFGEETLGSITLNLKNTWFADSVKIIVALSILFTYGLQFTVPTEIVWKRLGKVINEKRHTLGYYSMRLLMILGTVIIAIIVPQLGPIISLVGAVCLSILGLFCPAIIDSVTRYETGYGFLKWSLVKNIVIAVLSIIALVSGAYSSIIEIIEAYS